jgi:hypothetical protein
MLRLALGHVGSEDVVEAAVFADDHDDMFDRASRVIVARLGLRGLSGERIADCELEYRDGYQSSSDSPHGCEGEELYSHLIPPEDRVFYSAGRTIEPEN